MMIRKRGNSKVLLLTFEDLSSDTAIITRLESFIDIIKERKASHYETRSR